MSPFCIAKTLHIVAIVARFFEERFLASRSATQIASSKRVLQPNLRMPNLPTATPGHCHIDSEGASLLAKVHLEKNLSNVGDFVVSHWSRA